MGRLVRVWCVCAATGVAALGLATPAGAAISVTSPSCDAALAERLDWATAVDAQWAEDHASPDDSPTESLLRVYTALRLCDGDVIQQSGDTLRGPKEPGEAPTSTFQPSGRVSYTVTKSRRRVGGKGRRRSARTLSCSNTAYDPQFLSGTVRAGGRSACTTSGTLTATTCVGRYFQSTGNTDQQACKQGTVTGSAITIYTSYIACSSVISYRTNFYGVTGDAFSFYFNGASNGC